MEEQFKDLAKQWENASMFHSFWHCVNEHPAYLEIKDMGEDVVPFIVDKLRASPDMFWCAALSEITGITLDMEKYRDGDFYKFNVKEISDSWVAWYDNRE